MIDLEAEKSEIEKVLRRTEAAENRKDIEAMLEDFTEGCVFQTGGQPQLKGKDACRVFYRAFFKSGFISTKISCLDREVSLSADMSWEYGSFVSEFETPAGLVSSAGKYLGVMQKIGGRWKMAAVCITGDS